MQQYMKDKIRFALLGCGRIAAKHAEILGGSKIKDAELVAVCDLKEDRAAKFGAKYSIPYYVDMNAMMTGLGDEVDVVNILTESGMHAKNCIELAKYKKHIVVEKPMALTLEDADNMVKICDEARVKLFVVKQNRYNLPVVKLREAIEKKRFGKIVMGTVRVRWCRTQEYYDKDFWRGTWAQDGGVFTNQASHHIDLLERMLGEPLSVFAISRTALVDIETEDTGVAVVRFKSGALGIVEATTATRPVDLEGSISILGEKGTVEIAGFAVNKMKTWRFTEPEPGDDEVMAKYSVNPPNVYGFGHQAYLEHVTKAIKHDTPSLVDGFEGRKSLELVTAIYESIETGKEVTLRFSPKKCRLGQEP